MIFFVCATSSVRFPFQTLILLMWNVGLLPFYSLSCLNVLSILFMFAFLLLCYYKHGDTILCFGVYLVIYTLDYMACAF